MISESAQAEVGRVLASGMLVQGAHVARFEEGLAARTARRHAVVVSNGSAALYLALRALEIGPGDEVLCPALTWPSPAHAVRSLGATVRLVDVTPDRWNASPEAFRTARSGRTRAAIAIDQFGNPCDFEEIEHALAGLPVLRDAACALGATVDGAEAAHRGVIACLSFHPRKVVTTGEGGACLTDDDAIAGKLRAERNHGQSASGRFILPGLNYRLTEVAAAIGIHQLDRLDEMVARRRDIAATYRKRLPLPHQRWSPRAGPNEQTFGLVVGPKRDAWIDALRERGVQGGILSYALGRLASVGDTGSECPVAERLADEALALPLFPELSGEDVDQVIEAVLDVHRSVGGAGDE